MGNKTIYVSEKDESLFEEAKTIAGEALSSVIVRALREYVTRNTEKAKGIKEITVKVGPEKAEREKRFLGQEVSQWSGFSDDKVWWLSAKIYRTQKGNWAVHLTTVCKANLLTDPKSWKKDGEYLSHTRNAELFVAASTDELQGKIPTALLATLWELQKREETRIEYLDI